VESWSGHDYDASREADMHLLSGVNPAATLHELAHYFTITGPKAIFADPELIHNTRGGLQLSSIPHDIPILALGTAQSNSGLAVSRTSSQLQPFVDLEQLIRYTILFSSQRISHPTHLYLRST
jgi:hypothetical protein